MIYGIVLEKVDNDPSLVDYYYAHIPALGLITHGEGVEGAPASALDLVHLWLAEKRSAGEPVRPPSEFFFSTVEVPDDALQSA